MASLIHAVQSPTFQKVGVMDIETFFPAKDRFALAMKLNNLLASPGFAGWLEGDALDVGSLLYTTDGKPRLSVLSIAHLSDNERMFFITILLNEVLAWVRTQPGTSSLRAVLYMDEIFGYFPPTSNPPSKVPMLTLLKQARAFGLGVVLATQNPVDLDYKGLSNAGTWFLGRLQTQRDKDRVLEGLEGASTAAGHAFDRKKMDEILSGLGSRVFVMNNVHEDQPVIFQTRWTLSYLRGPLTREQIQTLMGPRKQATASGISKPGSTPPATASAPSAITVGSPSSPSLTSRRWLEVALVLSYRLTFLSSLCRVVRVLERENRLFIDQRYWVWPGCIMPKGKPVSTSGRRSPLFGGSMTRCRLSPGMRASHSMTACRSSIRPPRQQLDSIHCLRSCPEPRAMPRGPSP